MNLSKIRSLLSGRASLVYLISEEEERVEKLIAAAVAKAHGNACQIYSWSCLRGLTRDNEHVVAQNDPVEGLDHFLTVKGRSILIFKDLHLFIHSTPRLIRQLKECGRAARMTGKKIFFICPQLILPDELFSHFRIEDVALPGYPELSRLLDACIAAKQDAEAIRNSLTDDLKEKLVRAAMGFTLAGAADAFEDALARDTSITIRTVDSVLDEKQMLIRKSGVLEYVSTQAGAWEIGGLINLKRWLADRRKAFSPEAAQLGLTPPKGMLVMGVSGCGKSLCIKAIAAHWKLPLLRLDMGRIYDGLAGLPEEAMRKAIKTAEAVAPCVLWIDEIEAGIANQQQKQVGGKEARVLALFLTWMQEKTAAVFVGATANEVEVLPPEILRKGRFDELFYMGLPLKDERREILEIHMTRRNVDPKDFDMDYLADSTEGLNGAEIEQGIISAIFESSSQQMELTEHVISNALRNIVPLSRTMRERIQKIEAWARDRAMKASLETM
ncbi:MAG TPA: AAA family ATPase [Desulfomonilaceae bacterium]|nr:AAA family ATPase [Desulfomonilaceae bacterium]